MAASTESTPPLTPSPSRSPSPTLPAQPDHFYSPDGDVHPAPSPGHAWLTPDNDPLATKGIPVFKPTMDEFQDFEAYMMSVEGWGMRSGIVKIIPPKEWTDSLPSILPQLANVKIESPIEQHMLGRAGIFRQQNIVRRKALSVREWAELCAKEDYRAPAVDEVGLKAAGEHAPHVKRRNKPRRSTAAREEEVMAKDEVEDETHLDDTVSVRDPATPVPGADVDFDAEVEGDEDVDVPRQSPSQTSPTRKRRFPTRQEREAAAVKRAELDAAFLETFDPHTAWLPRNTSASDYTPSFCSTLERRYWRNCGLGKPPWYGADTAGTLFTDETTTWNIGSLPSALSRLMPKSSAGLPGVNTPYLYFGMWRATFAWHVEDMDLFSINYIHWGAPKFWYAIPQMRAMQLENTLRSFFPRDGSKCRQFLRHKSFLASPTLLAQSSCKPNTLVQHAGEFVITYPHGYHAGFNLGLNCAESVNFALESWLNIGRKAQACGCVGDSVRIDIDALLRARKEEEKSEKTSKSPSKPRSKKRKTEGEGPGKSKLPRKRKSDGSTEPNAKKQKAKLGISEVGTEAEAGPSCLLEIKRKITLKLPKDPGPYPCCLCVSRDTAGLLRVHDPPNSWSGCSNVLPKDTAGQAVWRAHESCAMVVPETWVDEETNEEGQVEKMVFGVDAIVKDRWALNCSMCPKKSRARSHGAPIQCTKGKCPKAFHISCARKDGPESRTQFAELREVEKEVVFSDMPQSVDSPRVALSAAPPCGSTIVMEFMQPPNTEAPFPSWFVPEPTEENLGLSDQANLQPSVIKTIKKVEYELLCPLHNPVLVAARRAGKVDRVRNELLALPAMSRVKLRVSAGVFEVSLLSVNEERNTVEVIWDEGARREFKWSSLVWGKTGGQTVGQKPTVAAPLQEHQPHSRLNACFAPTYATMSHSETPTTNTQPSFPGYEDAVSGRFRYSGWANAFYAYGAPASANTGNSSTTVAPGAQQSAYPYFSHAAYQPPMASLTWTPPTVSTQQGCVATPSPDFQQAVASSSSDSTSSGPQRATDSSTNTSSASSNKSSASADPTDQSLTATNGTSNLPLEVRQAVEELQKLSSLGPAELMDMLGSRPELREAVKILLECQTVQAQTSAQTV